jgi:hypothetical protein
VLTRAEGWDDARLLDGWDRAATLPRPWRELVVLASATGEAVETLARLPIGVRDARLLQLRIDAFGPDIDCETVCPACGIRLELPVDARALLLEPVAPDASAFTLSDGDRTLQLRLLDSTDIAASLERSQDGDDAAQVLAARCIDAIDGAPIPGDARITIGTLSAIADRLAALDPQADLTLALTCVSCGHAWAAPFDPAATLLADVESYAERLTLDVHVLARAYGWAESAILAMTATRRERYLSLVQQ